MSQKEDKKKPFEIQEDFTLDTIPVDGQRLLKEYSNIPEDELVPHVRHVVRPARPSSSKIYLITQPQNDSETKAWP